MNKINWKALTIMDIPILQDLWLAEEHKRKDHVGLWTFIIEVLIPKIIEETRE